jgi:hypothetical protein
VTYRVGQQVTIYEDPYTRVKPEGEAVLRELYRESGNETYWRVEFISEPGAYYERTVVLLDGERVEAVATESDR